jgi:hypothetical protein
MLNYNNNDMKKILIITLGNRDLQLSSDAAVIMRHFELFEKGGVDAGQNKVIKKSEGRFLSNSEEILNNYEALHDKVVFPMVETYLDQMQEKPDLIVLVSSHQTPADPQDCHFVAEFLKRWLEDRSYNVDYYPLECSPIDFPELVNVFSMFYDGYRNDELYVGNSGGTPDMRAATYAAGFFRDIRFITIQAREKNVNISNFHAQEKLVLKHIVENMLANFDYSGLLNLPLRNEILPKLAEYALARLSLDFESANEVAENMARSDLKILENGYKLKEKEAWISAKIKFKQKAWGDYLWRFFLIQDNLWVSVIEAKLDGPIIFNKQSNFSEWKRLIAKDPELIKFLENEKLGGRPLEYEKPVKVVYKSIIRYMNRNNALGKEGFNIYFEIDKILDNSLRELRNRVAHNYSSINLGVIEDELGKSGSSVAILHQKMALHTGVNSDSYGIYDVINAEIISYF